MTRRTEGRLPALAVACSANGTPDAPTDVPPAEPDIGEDVPGDP